MKVCFLFILSTFLFFSCKPKSEQYNIKGRLINSCDNSPIKNVKIIARQSAIHALTPAKSSAGFEESATSDDNGSFEISYTTAQKSPIQLLETTLSVGTTDLGDIRLYSNSKVYYKVKVNNAHTNLDTLFIVDITSPNTYYKMYGPFHDTVIGIKTVTAVNTLANNSGSIQQTNTTNKIDSWYKINRKNYSYSNGASIMAQICHTIPDTLTLIVN